MIKQDNVITTLMAIVKKKYCRVMEKPAAGDKVVFLFTAMATRIGLYRLFVAALNRRGYSCVVYDYPLRIVHDAKHDEWHGLFDEVLGDATGKIAKYKKQGKKHFYAYGVSMGTLFAHKLGRENADISHVVLNLTYGDVASNLWTFWGVRKTMKNLIAQGHTMESARDVVAFIDPIVNAPKLKDKKVLLYLSKPDRIIVYKQSKYTLQAFKDAKLDLEYEENKYLGHFLGGAKNMMSIGRLERFLKS